MVVPASAEDAGIRTLRFGHVEGGVPVAAGILFAVIY